METVELISALAIVAVAIISVVGKLIEWKLGRKAKKEDDKKKEKCATDATMDVLKDALKVIMLDRILHLGRAYIHEQKVDADDRRRLISMHKVYHDLGGNGDADLIMAGVNELQLTK